MGGDYYFTIEYKVSCRFSYILFIELSKFSLLQTFLRIFTKSRCSVWKPSMACSEIKYFTITIENCSDYYWPWVWSPALQNKTKKKKIMSRVVVYTYNLSTWRLREEECQFQASLGYIRSSSPSWTTLEDPISKEKKRYVCACVCIVILEY
jgi:hypothetical protein